MVRRPFFQLCQGTNSRRHTTRSARKTLLCRTLLRSHARGETVQHLQSIQRHVRPSSFRTTTRLESLPKHTVHRLQRSSRRELLLERSLCATAVTLRWWIPVHASAAIPTIRPTCPCTITRTATPTPTTRAALSKSVPTANERSLSTTDITTAPATNPKPTIPTATNLVSTPSTTVDRLRR